jgi:hypothetical protein
MEKRETLLPDLAIRSFRRGASQVRTLLTVSSILLPSASCNDQDGLIDRLQFRIPWPAS